MSDKFWIQTFDGKEHHFADPQSFSIEIETIATVLSRTCRFSGHCMEFYSVAQHSVLVASLVPSRLRLAALLHDAHEVYTGFGDVVGPVKLWLEHQGITVLRSLERKVDIAIAERFGFLAEEFEQAEVWRADMVALATEVRDVMGGPPARWCPLPCPADEEIVPQSMEVAYASFMAAFKMVY